MGQQGVGTERATQQSEDEGDSDEECSSIEAITEGAAPQRADDEERQLNETDQSHPQTRAGAFVYLIGDRDDGEVTAKYRDELAEKQQSKVFTRA